MEDLHLTYLLIGASVVSSFYAWNNDEIKRKWIFNPYVVNTRKEYFRFLSSGFIHLDHMHLIWNMLALYFFGLNVEAMFRVYFGALGMVYFLVFYLSAIVVSDIPTYFKNRSNPAYNSLGASGGVSAVLFASIIFFPLEYLYLYFVIPIPGFILGFLYLIYSYYQGKASIGKINHDAHLYGSLYGIAFCFILSPKSFPMFIQQIIHWRPFDF